jgi:hypothetical protein
MAERAHSSKRFEGQDLSSHVLVEWTGLVNGDTGEWIRVPQFADKTFHAYGTFGVGGNVQIEGSNEDAPNVAGTNAGPLNDPGGSPINITAANEIEAVLENPLWVRPKVTAGDGTTSLTVRMLGRRR